MSGPPRYYFRPRIRPILFVCWLRGHRFVRTSYEPDGWGNHTFECVRCDKVVGW